jgi:hypothetical protein
MSPSARALKDLRDMGYIPWVVERLITRFIKRDLFNVIDILALKGTETLAIQVTAGSGHANRCKKVKDSEYLQLMQDAGWVVQVWSYRKNAAGRYIQRITEINGHQKDAISP